MVWLLFAILANLFYSAESILDQLVRKNHVRHDASLTVLWIAFYSVIWLLLIPFIDISLPATPQLAAAVLAGFVGVFVSLPYFYALSNQEVSRVMPMWQFSSLFVLMFSAVFLSEVLSVKNYYGFALMFLAGLILAVEKVEKSPKFNKTMLVVIAASVFWAATLTLTKFFYLSEDFWNGFFWIGVGHLLGAVLLLAFPKNLSHLRANLMLMSKKSFSLLASSTFLTFFGQLSFLFAIKSGPVSLVSVVGSAQIAILFIMTIFLSYFFPKILKERTDRKTLLTKSAAIALMLVGIFLLNGGA